MTKPTKEEVKKTQTDLVAITDAQDLRGHILGGATHGGQHSAWSKELGQAKVCNLDGRLVSLVHHQHVLQLQIPVHDACTATDKAVVSPINFRQASNGVH